MDSEYFSSGVKRGNDDGVHVGNGMGDSDAKKAKFEPSLPSRVVHIRGLPMDCTDMDVIQLGLPFGKMTNILMYKTKSQAFLEFFEESNAVAMVSYFTTNNAQIKNRPCFVQFSNHKELKTDSNPQNNSAITALHAAQGMISPNSLSTNAENTILRVIVDNILYPVTLDVLHQLFSRYGKIMKIITFTKNNVFQSLIQFSDPISAATAKDSLDSQNIYNGCNTLKIEYSRLTRLEVKFNNDKSRDYTNPELPTGDSMDNMGMNGNHGMGAGVLGAGGAMGGGMGGGMGGHMGGNMGGNFNFGQMPNMNMNMAGRMAQMGQMGAAGAGNGSPCILVSNLDEQKANPENLFTLFGVYGNVHRVKILFNKKDNALVQMADPAQAQQAITYLDKVKLWGKQLRVAPSKHMLIQMPKDGQSDAGLTRDYVNSPHHRFKRSGSKNYIFPPTSVLHLYNVQNLEEDNVRSMFSQNGTVRGFKFFNNDRKMALIEMGSVEEATLSLMGLHNYQVGDNLHLRVSFSKSTI